MNNLRSRIFFLLAFLILLILSFLVIRPFGAVIIFTFIVVIVLKPAYNYFLGHKRLKTHKRVAASFTLIVFVLALFIPLFILLQLTISQLSALLADLDGIGFSNLVEEFGQFINKLPFTGDISIDYEQIQESVIYLVQAVILFLSSIILDLLKSIPSLIIGIMIFVVFYVTLMPEYDQLLKDMEGNSPLGREISQLYHRKTAAMVNSLVYGIFLIAIIQGVSMGFFYWLAGIEYVFLLILISIAFAVLPVVGISYLTLFIALIFILQGEYTSAAIVLLGFYGVVNWIDILLRPRLISKEAYTNFALVLLGILGGMLWVGFLGLFIGPTIILLLVTTIQIYRERFAQEDGVIIKNYICSPANVGENTEDP